MADSREMPLRYPLTYFSVIVYLTILTSVVESFTDPLDVQALQNLYNALNYPPELIGWRKDGGDPCGESWTGVLCSGSSVIDLKLNGLNLSGNLGDQLYILHNLQHLDVSSNRIQGEFPIGIPPNVTHLNLSHNILSGPIGNVFSGLRNLVEMDLSHNDFTGDLPTSFGLMTNIKKLFLQKNKFTGSLAYLSGLPLTDLNIQDNYFSGTIPEHFRTIPNLWIGGNRFLVQDSSPSWDLPSQTTLLHCNKSVPSLKMSNAIENCASQTIVREKRNRVGHGGIALVVGGGTLTAISAALFLAICKKKIYAKQRSTKINVLPHSLPLGIAEDGYTTGVEDSLQSLPLSSPLISDPSHRHLVQHARTVKISNRESFSEKCGFPSRIKIYSMAELQSATNNFCEENFLREGSLGSVYKANLPDGHVLAVKRVELKALSFTEEQQFLDVVCTASRLIHPNIVRLLGYSVEKGQHLLAYEYVRNITLDDALHGAAQKALSWRARLQIAIGVAKALDYLHNAFFPPFSHCDLKAANVLLDEEMIPHICDCGLSVLKPLASTRAKIKASETGYDERGYLAPEYGQPGIDNTKSDVFAFGVLLLELITGRKPNDLGLWNEDVQFPVKCGASFQLPEINCLEQMVDPGIKGTFSSKILCRFADIISLCIQPTMESRPPMFAVIGSLTSIQKRIIEMEKRASTEGKSDIFEKSFRTSNSGFISSPAFSCSSI